MEPMSELTSPAAKAGDTIRPRQEVKTVLIVNTRARTGEAALAEARQRLEQDGVALQAVHALEDPSKLGETIEDSVQNNAQLIVVGGGDGSLRTAAGVLAHTDTALGVLPLGTVNDFARNLGIEATVEAACRVIAGGHTAQVDVGFANDDPFLITASLGFSAEAQRALTPGLKKTFGPLGYLVASLMALRRLRDLEITFQTERGEEKMRVLQAGLVNGHSWMGGAFEIPGVDLEEGRLAFYALPKQSLLSYLRIARDIKHGEFFHTQGLKAFTTREMKLRTRSPQPLVLDGDLQGQTPAHIRILPGALKVCAPLDFPQASSESLAPVGSTGKV